MLCSFAHHACSPLLQGFLHEEALCKVPLLCHFALDMSFPLSGLGGILFLEFCSLHSAASCLTLQMCWVRRQYEVVSLVFFFLTCGQCLHTVAAFCRCDGRRGRRAQAHGRWSSMGTVLRRRWKRNVCGAFVLHVLCHFEFIFFST